MVKKSHVFPFLFSDGFCTALFRTYYENAQVLEEQSANATQDLLETFISYWQTKDIPVEYILTT